MSGKRPWKRIHSKSHLPERESEQYEDGNTQSRAPTHGLRAGLRATLSLFSRSRDPSPVPSTASKNPISVPLDDTPSSAAAREIHSNSDQHSPDVQAVDAARLDAATGVSKMSLGNDAHSPKKPLDWTSFLKRLSQFNSVIDEISAIYPYAKIAWKVLSFVSQAAIDQMIRDESVHALLLKMDDVYLFLTDQELQDINLMKTVVERIAQQTLECSYFIQKYSTDTKFWARLVKNLMSGIDERVKEYSDVLDKLLQDFRDRAARETVVVVHRIWTMLEDLAGNMDLNSMPYAAGAGLNTEKLCMDGTRKDVLDEITDWVDLAGSDTPRIFWLYGIAGAGKSSIAHTIANRFKKRKRLGSCFCFDRNAMAEQRHKKIFATIAQDLASHESKMRMALASAVHDPSLRNSPDILQQWQEMIEWPAKALSDGMVGPILIVIDALDESGNLESRRRLLQILGGAVDKDNNCITSLPPNFRILVTSRPLPDIVEAFTDIAHVRQKSMDSISSKSTEDDILSYVSSQLPQGTDHHMHRSLAHASCGLFEWARLACAYVRGDDDAGPGLTARVRFESIMTRNVKDSVLLLDDMYNFTLKVIFPDNQRQRTPRLKCFKAVMAQILGVMEPLHLDALNSMRRHFVNAEEFDIRTIVRSMGALLSGTMDPSVPIRPLHASFRDFLTGEQSSEFFISLDTIHSDLTFAALGVMHAQLRFDMCQLPSSHIPNSKVPNLEDTIKNSIRTELAYSCRFWAEHLNKAAPFDSRLAEKIGALLESEKLLYWFEALSLLKKLNTCPSALSNIIQWIQRHAGYKHIIDDAVDARNFIRMFGGAISFCTPHLYLSAITFSPKDSRMSRKFRDKFCGLARIVSGENKMWPAAQGVLTGHSGDVRCVAFSRDGMRITSGSVDRTIRLWDAETGELLRPPLQGHKGCVSSVAFSPDGMRIVSGSADKTIRLWDTDTGELLTPPLQGHEDCVSSVAFSPDGSCIVSGSLDETIRLWDAETGELLRPPLQGHEDRIHSVAFSPDGTRIVSGSADKTICLWDAATGALLRPPIQGHEDCIHSVAFSPDGMRIVSGSADKTVCLWDAATGELLRPPLQGHGKWVSSVAFSPDGTCIVSGSDDKTVCLWDADTGELLRPPLQGHEYYVSSVAFSPDGTRILSGSDDWTIRLWDAEAGELLRPPLQEYGHISSVAFSPDGACIVSGSRDNAIRLWDAQTGELLQPPLQGHEDWVVSVAFSSDGTRVVSGSDDKMIRLWDADTGELLRPPLQGHEDCVSSVAFSPDGMRLVSGSRDGLIHLWDAETGELLRPPLQGHKDCVRSVAFSPDGMRIVSGSADKTIRLWDAATGQLLQPPLQGHEDCVTSVAFSPDGTCIVSGSFDETIRLWDAETGELLRLPIQGQGQWVFSVAFSPDGTRIVSGSYDKMVRLWDAETGEMLRPPLQGHEHWVVSVAFSPDGTCIVSGSEDKTIRLWQAEVHSLTTWSHVENTLCIPAQISEIRTNGWLIGCNDELLLWLPSHLCQYLSISDFCLTIPKGVEIDVSQMVHGQAWQNIKNH